MTPYKCPVCGGCGRVPGNFYHPLHPDVRTIESSAGPQLEICRACNGSGIVWGAPHYPARPMPWPSPMQPPWPTIEPTGPPWKVTCEYRFPLE